MEIFTKVATSICSDSDIATHLHERKFYTASSHHEDDKQADEPMAAFSSLGIWVVCNVPTGCDTFGFLSSHRAQLNNRNVTKIHNITYSILWLLKKAFINDFQKGFF